MQLLTEQVNINNINHTSVISTSTVKWSLVILLIEQVNTHNINPAPVISTSIVKRPLMPLLMEQVNTTNNINHSIVDSISSGKILLNYRLLCFILQQSNMNRTAWGHNINNSSNLNNIQLVFCDNNT